MMRVDANEWNCREETPMLRRTDGLIRSMATLVGDTLPPSAKILADFDDLYQEAKLRVAMLEKEGKIHDAMSIDALRLIIYYAMMDCLRSTSFLSRDYIRYVQAIDHFYTENNRNPTSEEFARIVNVEVKTATSILHTLHEFRKGLVSVEELFGDDESTDEGNYSFMADTGTTTPEQNVMASETMTLVKSSLDEREWSILEEYISGVTEKGIADKRYVTESAVSQSLIRIRKKLERKLRKAGIYVEGHRKSKSKPALYEVDIQKMILDTLEQAGGKPVLILKTVRERLIAQGYIRGCPDEVAAVNRLVYVRLNILKREGYKIKREKGRGSTERAIWLEK